MTTILFDVDGVFLSEERCFDVSALTVEELLYSPRYLNLDGRKFKAVYTDEEIADIRNTIFVNDRILQSFKEAGLNSNWDMLFITFSVIYLDILEQEKLNLHGVNLSDLNQVGDMLGDVTARPEKVLEFLKETLSSKEDIYQALIDKASQLEGFSDQGSFHLYGPLWSLGHYKYQEWYLGSDLVEADTGKAAEEVEKSGYIHDEEWIVEPRSIVDMLEKLKEAGYTIGVATGRPRQETLLPFEQGGLDECFDQRRISTASEVMAAQEKSEVEHALTKPHPFSYLWSFYMHNDTMFEEAVNGNNVSDEQIYIVGDSVADFYCAKAIGATFLGPLTGLTGEDIKDTFYELGVKESHLMENVLDVPLAIKELEH